MKYPIGIQNFESLINDGYIYVDKTEMVYNIAHEGRYYFLSRPRRFGKSLLLSTFEAYFKGKRELFDGLAIGSLEHDWTEYPVLRLDLNSRNYLDESSLNAELNNHLEQWEKMYGDENNNRAIEERFRNVIKNACEKTGQRVVILVDEYDKPLLQTINNPELQEIYRGILRAFYGNLKSCDEYIRFAFLTGVTRFGKISVFSDLNNLDDISLDNRFSSICGMTEEEIHGYFEEGVSKLAMACGMSEERCYEKLKVYYDGYLFSIKGKALYNPFSVLKTLSRSQFGEYWFDTGTPDILAQQLQNTSYPLENISREEVTSSMLGNMDVNNANPLPLMYQSGYLTIKDYDSELGTFTLGFPNREVELGFNQFLAAYYIPMRNGNMVFAIGKFIRDIREGNAEGFMSRLAALLADGNYQVVGDCEIYFQNTLYVFFKLLGFHVEVERHTSDGRMDILMQTKDYVYIIEIKLNKTADIALKQIDEKGYATPFASDPRRLFKIGINFNTSRRCIDDWKVV